MSLSRQARHLSLSRTFSKLQKQVTCAVCYELLNNPKVFPCLHSYCYECIVKLSECEGGLICPECRAPVEVRSLSSVLLSDLLLQLQRFWQLMQEHWSKHKIEEISWQSSILHVLDTLVFRQRYQIQVVHADTNQAAYCIL